MTQTFSATVDDWVRETDERMMAVARTATQATVEDALTPRGAGGRMRVDTGFLRASGQASLANVPLIDPNARPVDGAAYPQTSAYALVIQSMKPGDTFHYGFTAAYAAHREYGANGQTPDAFVRGAVLKWQSFVDEAAKQARARA